MVEGGDAGDKSFSPEYGDIPDLSALSDVCLVTFTGLAHLRC